MFSSSLPDRAGQPPAGQVPTGGAPEPRRFTTEQLFAGAQEIEILHGQALYRMRLTSLGKLILTK